MVGYTMPSLSHELHALLPAASPAWHDGHHLTLHQRASYLLLQCLPHPLQEFKCQQTDRLVCEISQLAMAAVV